MTVTTPRLGALCTLAFAAACGGDDGKVGVQDSAELVIAVAPLDVPGVDDASYTLRVKRADGSEVWNQSDMHSAQYGTGSGSLSYVGACDAAANPNTVEVELDGLWGEDGSPMSGWVDPGTLSQSFVCTKDHDVRVEFHLALARSATSGFFDIAVAFDELYCSARLECPGAFLHREDGTAGPTAVIAFACTGDPSQSIWLYFSDVTLTCGDKTYTIDPTDGPGYLGAQAPDVFQTAVFSGHTAHDGFDACEWSATFGIEPDGTPCTLSARATASRERLANGATPADTSWPVLVWDAIPIAAAGATLDCGSQPLDGAGSHVRTDYTAMSGETFAYELGCEAGHAEPPQKTVCSTGVGATAAIEESIAGLVITLGDAHSEPFVLGETAELAGCCEFTNEGSFIYGVVEDALGEALGSFKCTKSGDDVTCDTEADGRTLKLYPELMCGGADGDACDDPSNCESEFCVDGICCNEDCAGEAIGCFQAPSCVTGTCVVAAVEDGTGCDDGKACTSADSCSDGDCAGTVDCQTPPSECRETTGACDEAGACAYPAKPADAACADDGNPCTIDTCDGAGNCVHLPGNVGALCREAVDQCDVAEACDGTHAECPSDAYAPPTTVCREANGACDAAETCSGASPECPSDAKVDVGTTCRESAGGCDVAEACDGVSDACPDDGFADAGTECRGAAGVCDAAEHCSGTDAECPDDHKVAEATECRGLKGQCDVAEVCDGVHDDCPTDALAPATTTCRDALGACDVVERCTGDAVDCPIDGFAAVDTACGSPSATDCDAPDTCDGHGACVDRMDVAATPCRASKGECDVAETCTGDSKVCPADLFVAIDTACGDPSDEACNAPDTCDGAGSCVDRVDSSATTCRASTGQCDVAETCDGSAKACPADGFMATGTSCGSASDVACDAPDTCDGHGACVDRVDAAATTCRAATGQCDVAEACDGSAKECPSDDFRSEGTACGSASATDCDAADTCDGHGACVDRVDPATTTCRNAAGACDTAELCTGATKVCPANTFVSAGTACGSASDVGCDAPDQCDGQGACVDRVDPSTSVCRDSIGVCDPEERCTGASKTCPSNDFLDAGTSCGSANATECDAPDSCDATGHCVDRVDAATVTCRASAGQCDVAEQCDGAGKACPTDAFEDVGKACGSASSSDCDAPDSCDGNGACIDRMDPATTTCRGASGQCDVAEQCSGSSKTCPVDAFVDAGAACGNSSDAACDAPDTCNGQGACIDRIDAATTVCRDAIGACDVAELCDGSSKACPTNGFQDVGTACGSASATDCDAPDTCDGSGGCIDRVDANTVTCRGAASVCDVAEQCTGASKICPSDAFAGAGTTCGNPSSTECDAPDSCDGNGSCIDRLDPDATPCRNATGQCDVAEFCNGTNKACPVDGFQTAGTSCGSSSSNECDAPDSCDGSGACVDRIDPAATTCRIANGQCDVAEQCNGTSKACPVDAFQSAGTSCGSSSSAECDAPDTCNGSGACIDRIDAAATECRPGNGLCDPAEQCNGASKLCPANTFTDAGTACGSSSSTECDAPDSCDGQGSCIDRIDADTVTCRGASGQCDVAEKCTGTLKSCPVDTFQAVGTACGSSSTTECDAPDSCDGSGACVDRIDPAATTCRGASGQCDVAEQCNGSSKSCPVDAFQAVGTSCGSSSSTECDAPDTCDGSGACVDRVDSATTECRAANGTCDPAEMCNGTGKLCPTNTFTNAGVACGSSNTTECDAPDTCDGSGSCIDRIDASTVTCRGAASACDVAELCSGSTKACPVDAFQSAGTACGSASTTECDAPDSCDGSGACVDRIDPAATTCRAASGQCDVAEQCNGASKSCPVDAFQVVGTSCGSPNSSECDAPDSCDGSGACVDRVDSAATECRAANGTCDPAEMCNGTGKLCPTNTFTNAGTACGSSNATECDAPDSCDGSGSCIDRIDANTVTCRGAASACDVAELCSGSTKACPVDAFQSAGTACGSSSTTDCDAADSCDGSGACIDRLDPSSTTCRGAAGECDVAEQCTGSSKTCPSDTFKNLGASCGSASATDCDAADSCDGAGACIDRVDPSTTSCRASTGTCDVAESCTGSTKTCPGDTFQPSGTACGSASTTDCDAADTCNGSGSCIDRVDPSTTTCRGAASACDVAETCDGTLKNCPMDGFQSAGTACGSASATDCDAADSCDGSGACIDRVDPSSTSCRASTGACDVAENCNGSSKVCPTDAFQPSGTACGSSSSTDCDAADTCNGSGSCIDRVDPSTTTCRASTGTCDVAENCNGSGKTCPGDGFQPSGTACGSSSSTDCDAADTCNGSGSCIDRVDPSSVTCRAAAGQCDVAESCDGSSKTCPGNGFVASGVACGSSSSADCDAPDTCNGAGACIDRLDSSAVVCRAAANVCDVAENCTGSSATCPGNSFAVAGTACGSSSSTDCDAPDSCDGGGTCIARVDPNGTQCRAGVGECNPPEYCNGSSTACPADTGNQAFASCGNCGRCTSSGSCTGQCSGSQNHCCEPGICIGSGTNCP